MRNDELIFMLTDAYHGKTRYDKIKNASIPEMPELLLPIFCTHCPQHPSRVKSSGIACTSDKTKKVCLTLLAQWLSTPLEVTND